MSTESYLSEWSYTLYKVILDDSIEAWNAMREIDHAYDRDEITADEAARRYVAIAREAFWRIPVDVPTTTEALSPTIGTAA